MSKEKIKNGGKIFGAFLLGVICTSGVSYAGNTGLIGDLFELVTYPDSTQKLYIKDDAFKDNSIDADALADGSVGLDQIGGNQIVTEHIKDLTIKNQDLEGGITSDKISGLSTGKLIGKISNDQLAGEITSDKISGLETSKLTGTISTTQIEKNAITVDKLQESMSPTFANPTVRAPSSDSHAVNRGWVNNNFATKAYVDSKTVKVKTIPFSLSTSHGSGYNESNQCEWASISMPSDNYILKDSLISTCKGEDHGRSDCNSCSVNNIEKTRVQICLSGCSGGSDAYQAAGKLSIEYN